MSRKVLLKDISKVISGSAAPKEEYLLNSGIPFVRAGNLESLINGLDINELPKVNPDETGNIKLKKAEANSILFAKSGMSCFKNRVYKTEEAAYFVSHLACVMPNEKIVNNDYLKYFFEWNKPSNLVRDESYPSIRMSDISNIQLQLPDLDNQNKIANNLNKSMELIKLRKQQIAALSSLKQSIFLDMFGDPNDCRNKFPKKKIAEYFDVQTGITPSRKNDSYWKDGNIPWVKTTEVKNRLINRAGEFVTKKALEEVNLKILPKDTILIAMYGQGKTRGQSGVLTFPSTTNQACAALIPNDNISTTFVWHQLMIQYETLRNLGRGGNQPNLNLGIIREFKIIVPPRSLQQQYCKMIQLIGRNESLLLRSLLDFENIYESLVQKAFNG